MHVYEELKSQISKVWQGLINIQMLKINSKTDWEPVQCLCKLSINKKHNIMDVFKGYLIYAPFLDSQSGYL